MSNKVNLKDFKENFKRISKYMKSSKKNLIISMILSIIVVIIYIVLPIISADMIVKLTSNMLYELLLITILYYILYLISSLLGFVSEKLLMKVENEIDYNMRVDIAKNVLKFTDETINENGTGTITTRMFSDTKEASNTFDGMFRVISQLMQGIGVLIGIFIVSKIMFIYIFIKEIKYLYIVKLRAKKSFEKDKEARKVGEKATSLGTELVRGQHDIKMLNAEKSFKNKFFETLNMHIRKSYEKDYINIKYDMYYDACYSALEFIEYALIIYLILSKHLIIVNAIVIVRYANETKYIGYSIDWFLKQINSFNLSCNRIFELIYSPKFEKEKFGMKHLNHINGDFEFKDVYFKYDKKEVLKGMSFKVNANETVAFVGKSGVGKTTIFNLLCGMRTGYKGLITIDGNDIKNLDRESIRGNITIVSQNPYIFNMSIRDNLRLIKEDAKEDEMMKALKLADLYDYVNNLPNKLDTVVGEGGVNLSGGERQRLAIARAFLQKTEIILMDEATSNLDNESQESITNAINNLKKNYTILIIAHRLSTIKNADKIIYIENGVNKAEGTHEELLKKCPGYKKLYESELIKK